ncbi:Hypothetical predicted protein, partial [Paramuricea clavata]
DAPDWAFRPVSILPSLSYLFNKIISGDTPDWGAFRPISILPSPELSLQKKLYQEISQTAEHSEQSRYSSV